jgi:RNA polymerase-associated protein CTR9
MHQGNEAHDLLKDSLASQSSNLNLRAYYTYFLIQSNAWKPAREFVFGTLRDHDKHDLYALCAAGWLHYHQARENRDTSPKGVEERRLLFRRAAEFYEKALGLDPMCAVAAQGLAIVIAEDALGTLGGALPPGPAPDEGQRRAMNARDALEVFARVRESTNDGSVYVNMGHCYFVRDELDRAIESVRALVSIVIVPSNASHSTRRRRSAIMGGVILPSCYVWHGLGTSRQTRNSRSRR